MTESIDVSAPGVPDVLGQPSTQTQPTADVPRRDSSNRLPVEVGLRRLGGRASRQLVSRIAVREFVLSNSEVNLHRINPSTANRPGKPKLDAAITHVELVV